MSVHGQLLEITVVGCRNLKDIEWISRQDPYVILDYAGNEHRTETHTDGGRNPSFNEKYKLPLIEGLREINVVVCNSNLIRKDDIIGSGKILLQKVLSEGYHDSSWPLTYKNGKPAGEIRVILHFSNFNGAHNTTPSGYTPHAPPVHAPFPSMYAHAPPVHAPFSSMYAPSSHGHYMQSTYAAPSAYNRMSQPAGQAGYVPPYPPSGQVLYPPTTSLSPLEGYAPPYPPQVYPPPQAYPPQGHHAPPQPYRPPQQGNDAPPPSAPPFHPYY